MMKYIVGFILFVAGTCPHLFAQSSESAVAVPQPVDYPVGKINRSDLQAGWFGDHFLHEYAAYEPEATIVEKLKNKIFDHRISIVLGFWCSDSRQQVPRFFKMLDRLRYDYQMIGIISVDEMKLAGDVDISALEIERVPTFIFYDGLLEKGRIIESPEETIEKDALQLLAR
jgi:hypothetical protein